jgi:hypothetical protein
LTYLAYGLWFLSLLWVAAEVDRLYTDKLAERWVPELAAANVWFLPPVISMVLPGAGQFLNNQLLKALLCFSWPILVASSYKLWPLQFKALHSWELFLPWYLVMVLDALVVGVVRHRRANQEDAELAALQADTRNDLTDFLARRQARQSQDR